MKLNTVTKLFQPDPFVIYEDGTYYMYSSNNIGVVLNTSKDMINWDCYGPVYVEKGKWEYWAPCIIKIGSTYYIYVSFRPDGSDDPHQEELIVCSSSSPYGPFKFEAKLVDAFAIDPHVVKSGEDYYIFYSINDYDADRAGTYIVCDKLISPTKVEGKPVAIVKPSIDEEIFQRNRFKVGQHWHTIEGAFYFRVGDYHYVMYSGNCYLNELYFVGYSVAYGKENDLRKLIFKKYPSDHEYKPLLCRDDKEEGTGHNSVLEKDGHYYMFYHARDNGILIPGIEQRTARLAELKADNGILKIIKR